MSYRNFLTLVGMIGSLGLASAAQAAGATITFIESGANVVGTLSGNFLLGGTNGLVTFQTNRNTPGAGLLSANQWIALGPSAGSVHTYYSGLTYDLASSTGAVSTLYTGATDYANTNTGSVFLFQLNNGRVLLPGSYSSGSAIASSGTWNNSTLASLGLNPGTYVWKYGSTSISTLTINVVATPVPEPGEWAAMGILGAGLAGLVFRKRRKV